VNKKVRSLLLACAAALGAGAFPLLTYADDTQALQARSLGIWDRVVQYCASSDPAAASQLRDKINELTKGLSNQQIADLRQSDEYHSAYTWMDGFVSQVDEHNTKRLCSESAASAAFSTATNNSGVHGRE
jgi:hypothetical protein